MCITLHNFAIWDRANIILETLQRNLQNKHRNEHRVQKSVQPLAASRWHSHPQMTEFAGPVSLKTWKEQSIFAQEILQILANSIHVLFIFYSFSHIFCYPFTTSCAHHRLLLTLRPAQTHRLQTSWWLDELIVYGTWSVYIYHIILYIYVYDYIYIYDYM